ncbi:hypothetical protein NYI51_19115, partial [Xanthomonas translucens pv. translucens]|uniref:hypothetical protein n=1 Tax=Xanthomonas campestris pv. translucens TaxID=343 RepID=UPI00216568F4
MNQTVRLAASLTRKSIEEAQQARDFRDSGGGPFLAKRLLLLGFLASHVNPALDALAFEELKEALGD